MSDDENPYQERDCDSNNESHGGEPLEKDKSPQANEQPAKHEQDLNNPLRKPPDWFFPSYYKPSPIYVINTKHHEKWSVDWWKHRLEIAELCGGFVVLAILAFQSCVMSRQYGEMTNTTKAIQGQISVAQGQLDAMTNQAAIMQQQLSDSEAQQRAWLRIETIQIKRAANGPNPSRYALDISMVFKNFGSTPATGLFVSGFDMKESDEAFDKKYGITNEFKRWNGEKPPEPTPGDGGYSIMPQETFTNQYSQAGFPDNGEWVYFQWWVSYKTIFGQKGIIGEGGTYYPTNDSFSPYFEIGDTLKSQNPTNK